MRAHAALLSLERFLADSLRSFHLPQAGAGKLAPPRLFLGDIEALDAEDPCSVFPFVIIRWTDGEDGAGTATESVVLVLGVYQSENRREAELVTTALLDHLRIALRRTGPLDRMFEIQKPLESYKPDPERKQNDYHLATLRVRLQHAVPDDPLGYGAGEEPPEWAT